MTTPPQDAYREANSTFNLVTPIILMVAALIACAFGLRT